MVGNENNENLNTKETSKMVHEDINNPKLNQIASSSNTSTAYNMRKRKKNSSPPSPSIDGYLFPKKTIKFKQGSKSSKEETNLNKNKFASLSDEDDVENYEMESVESVEKTEIPNTKYTKQNNRNEIPPPIILIGKPDSHKKLVDEIKNTIGENFYIKYTKYNTNVYTKEKDKFTRLKQTLIEKKTEFYTYTLKDEKTHAFVIRGLQTYELQDAIMDELKNSYKVPIKNVFTMKTKKDPLYMVITGSEIKLKDLQKKIVFVNHTKIQWERKYNAKKIIQCKNCQQWGHAASNCYSVPNCLKCGAEHSTSQCTIDENTPPRCANCSRSHLASSSDCPIYQYRLNKAKSVSQTNHYSEKSTENSKGSSSRNANTYNNNKLTNSLTNFPVLPCKYDNGVPEQSDSIPNIQASQWIKPPNMSNRPTRPIPMDNEFEKLTNEFTRTSELINISGLLKAVTDYNNLLEKCTTPTSKFQVSLKFFSEIDKYDL